MYHIYFNISLLFKTKKTLSISIKPVLPCFALPPQVKLSDRVVSTDHGLLIRSVQPSDQGLYYCLTTENGFKRTVAKLRLRVLSEALVGALVTKQQSPWGWAAALHPKALVSGFSPADALALQQYCKERKQLQSLASASASASSASSLASATAVVDSSSNIRGDMGKLSKLKPLLDRSKSRNRRNHLPEEEQ